MERRKRLGIWTGLAILACLALIIATVRSNVSRPKAEDGKEPGENAGSFGTGNAAAAEEGTGEGAKKFYSNEVYQVQVAEDVRIYGRGYIYLYHEPFHTHVAAVDMYLCHHIRLEGIVCLHPSGHSTGVAESHDIEIDSIKSFSCHGWSDGINFYSSEHCRVKGVFMRNSDDCVTVYGSRGETRGDSRDILFEDIRVEDYERGRLIDVRVFFNQKYNPIPGNEIENITFRNIRYDGKNAIPSQIMGYEKGRMVKKIKIENLVINGKKILSASDANMILGDYVEDVKFC